MASAVYLHVGTAKSGTTYLQRMMAHNRELLRRHGYLYPGGHGSHFMESLSLRETAFKGHTYPSSVGAWDRTAAEVRAHHGPALISHETLANTMAGKIQRAVESFPGSEVRVIITCRDLGRQIPAAFQERVKNGNTQSYADFLTAVFETWRGPATKTQLFWRTQNLVALGRRWAEAVGEENVCFVTVPQPGAAPDELWRRFAQAIDLPRADYEVSEGARNTSLGTAETELLRRLNSHFPPDLPWPRYEAMIKHRFVTRDLAPHEAGGKLSVPEEYQQATDDIADTMIQGIASGSFRLVGDLEELRPSYRQNATRPDEVTTDQLLDLALEVMAPMALRGRQGRLGEQALSGRTAVRVLTRAARRRLVQWRTRSRSSLRR